VPGDAALADLDQAFVVPVFERFRPGQREQSGRVLRGRSEDKSHKSLM
jgi:hypothetical protein